MSSATPTPARTETGLAFLWPLLSGLASALASGAAGVGLSLLVSELIDVPPSEQEARASTRDHVAVAELYRRALAAADKAVAAAARDAVKVAAIAAAHRRVNAYLETATTTGSAQGAVVAFEQWCAQQVNPTLPITPARELADVSAPAPTSTSSTSPLVRWALIGLGALVVWRALA